MRQEILKQWFSDLGVTGVRAPATLILVGWSEVRSVLGSHGWPALRGTAGEMLPQSWREGQGEREGLRWGRWGEVPVWESGSELGLYMCSLFLFFKHFYCLVGVAQW